LATLVVEALTCPAMRSFIERHHLLLIVTLAILVRLAIFLAFPGIFRFDQNEGIHGSDAYDAYAQNLLATGVYGREPGVPDAQIPPLYSYALAAVYAIFGRNALAVAGFHIALDVLCIICLYHTGKRLFRSHGQWIGAVACLAYALYPYLIFQNLTLIDTPFFMAQLHAFVLLLVLLRERPRWDRGTLLLGVLAGVVLGLSLLTRALLPLLAVGVALWFLFHLSFWETVRRLLPVAGVGLLVMVPWIVRNFQVYEAFVPTALNFGDNFYQGNSIYTIPYFRAGYDVQWVPPPEGPASEDRLIRARNLYNAGWEYLRRYPEQIPDLLWVKFLVHWSIDIAPRRNPVAGEVPRLDYAGNVIAETDAAGNLQLGALPPGDPVDVYSSSLFDQVGRTVHGVYWGGLLLLSLLGMAVTVREWRTVALLWFVQLSMTVMYVLFHPSTRYRVPSDPLLFLFAGALVVGVVRRWHTP
jgi:4-amino-4-deoxy-L-arabinose transferase-like glycosyltransferase